MSSRRHRSTTPRSRVALAWLPILVAAEVLRPRLRFDARRWSTVFPLGMYAAMGQVVGHLAGRTWIVAFGRDWTWVAAAVWLLVAAGTAARTARVLRV